MENYDRVKQGNRRTNREALRDKIRAAFAANDGRKIKSIVYACRWKLGLNYPQTFELFADAIDGLTIAEYDEIMARLDELDFSI